MGMKKKLNLGFGGSKNVIFSTPSIFNFEKKILDLANAKKRLMVAIGIEVGQHT